MWCITLMDLWIFKNPCIPGENTTWSCCLILLIYIYNPFAKILLRIFFIYVHQWYWPVIFTFMVSIPCLVLVSRLWWLHRMSLGVFLPLLFFGRVSEESVLTLLWIFDRICLCSHQVLDFCFLEVFNNIFNFSACDWSIHIFSFFLVQSWKIVPL